MRLVGLKHTCKYSVVGACLFDFRSHLSRLQSKSGEIAENNCDYLALDHGIEAGLILLAVQLTER